MARPLSDLDDMLAFRSDSKTSPHYLVGVPQSTSADVNPPEKSTAARILPVAGVEAGSGTMNDQPITIGERHGWGDSRRGLQPQR